jgi:hypothetical protein
MATRITDHGLESAHPQGNFGQGSEGARGERGGFSRFLSLSLSRHRSGTAPPRRAAWRRYSSFAHRVENVPCTFLTAVNLGPFGRQRVDADSGGRVHCHPFSYLNGQSQTTGIHKQLFAFCNNSITCCLSGPLLVFWIGERGLYSANSCFPE